MAPPKTSPTAAKRKSSNTPIIIGIVAAVVVIAAVVAIVMISAGGSDDDGTFAPGATVREFQGVTVTGDALPTLAGGDDPAVGTTAPGMKGAFFDGTPVEVTPGNGKPYMLVFLAHWCPHCNAEAPRLKDWFDSGAVPENLQVMGIATGSSESRPNWPPSRWLTQEMDWPWPSMADSPQAVAASTYGLDGYPFIVMVGSDGKVLARSSGELGNVAAIDQFVADALALDTGVADTDTTEAPADSTAPADSNAPADTSATLDTTAP